MQWIIDLLLNGFYTENVLHGAAWLPLAGSAVLSGINYLSQGKERRRARRERDKLTGERDDAMEQFREMIGGMEGRAEGVQTDASVDDLYGNIMQMFSDRTQAGTDQATSETFRTLMAGGGDVSGQGASMVNQLQQTGQQSIGDIIGRFTELTDRRNMFNQQRQDQMYGTALGYRGNMFGALSGMATDAQGRVDRRSTADRQFMFDSLGLGMQGVSTFGNLTSKPEPTLPTT